MAAEPGTQDVEMKAVEKEPEKADDETKTDEANADEAKSDAKKTAEPDTPMEAAGKPKEQEQDAEEEKRPKISSGTAAISGRDSTLNVMPTGNGKLLMSLMEGGFQCLLAGARATVGVKSGRYLVEIKLVEVHKAGEVPGSQGSVPMPRNLVRFGLSQASSPLFLGEGEGGVCFDSEGFFLSEKSKKRVTNKYERDAIMGLLINLEEGSPNANTVSMFRNGMRVSAPQAIPEKLLGKPLFPTVTYKNVTLQVNFGSEALAPLPFRCHMLSEATAEDVEVATVPEPAGGKHEVLFPVGLPQQGYFDWVDSFLEKNPEFTELSDRKIVDWAAKSGIWRPKTPGSTTDKPELKFGIPAMDDLSMRRILNHIAPTAKRSFLVVELKDNLLAAERKLALARFPTSEFKKTATVMVGEPTAEYKEIVQGLLLADKRAKMQGEHKRRVAEEERKRLLEERRKKVEEARKASNKMLAKQKGGGEEDETEAKAEDAVEPPREVELPAPELTEEEKGLWYRKAATADISEHVISKFYTEFSLPTADEGFDEVSYKWQEEAESANLLKKWVFGKKLTQRVDSIKPGVWFKEEWAKWTKSLQEWRKKQSEWKDPAKKKALLAAKAEARKKEAEAKGEEAAAPMDIDPEELEVFSIEDVNDIGNGEPLFANYAYEDWLLLSMRFELHLLLHSFRKDLNDPDRPSFTEKDLSFYFQRYFSKSFNLQSFNVEKLESLLNLLKDTLKVGDSAFLQSHLDEDTPMSNFVKLAEDHRRERQRRLDAGDETAELKFPRTAVAPALAPMAQVGLQGRAVRPALAPPRTPGILPGPAGGLKRSAGTAFRPPTAPHASAYVAKQPRTSPYGAGYNRK